MLIKDSLYKEIMKNVIIVTVDIIFINENKEILLGLRNNAPLKNIYYIPGGRIFKYENILDAAKRKTMEELGIKINKKKLIFLGIYDDIYKNDSFFGKGGSHYTSRTYIYLLNKNEEKKIKTDKQHSELKFFNINDKKIHSMVKIRIADINKLNIL